MSPTPLRRLIFIATIAQLGGCASMAGGSIADAGMKLASIGKAPSGLADAPRDIPIKLHAGAYLNTGPGGRPLALVARIYKLRQIAAFGQAPYDSFLDPQKEKELLGADLLEVKEVLLIPGQRFEVIEKASREAYFIGVVALFGALQLPVGGILDGALDKFLPCLARELAGNGVTAITSA